MSEMIVAGGLAAVGITVAGIAVALGAAVAVALWISKRRLNAKFDAEYGKRK